MKRSLLFGGARETALVLVGMGLVASTYGLVRLAYGLFLPDVQASLAMGDATAGRISSGAAVAYCVGALCGLAAGTRSRLLVLGALATASLGSLGMALAPGLPVFAVAAVVGSAGSGLASPGLVVVVERTVAAAHRDRAQATVNAGTGPGLVVAGLLALLLLPHWRLGFAAGAVAAAGTGLAVLLLDRRAAEGPGPAAPATDAAPGWFRTLGRPALAAALLGATSAVTWTYGRSHLVAEGAGTATSTVAWVALGLGGTFTVVTSPALSRWHPARAWWTTAGAVAGAVAALGLLGDRTGPALLACAVFGWGFVAATSALIAWAGLLAPARTGPATSLLFVTLVLGQGVGSWAAGIVVELGGTSLAFVLSAAVGAAAAACGLRWSGPARTTRLVPVQTQVRP